MSLVRGSGRRGGAAVVVVATGLAVLCGCERAWRNGFIDPTQTGRFESNVAHTEIRRTLGALEEPEGIPGAAEPTREDLVARYEEAPILRGDVLDISIFELFQPGLSTDIRRQVNEVGYISLPVIGPLKVAELSPRQIELAIIENLKSRQIMQDPEVAVSPVQSQARRFSVVGNVTRPGEYPLPRPDYRLLDVIGAIGPISPTQRKIYILRGGAPKAYTPPNAEAPYMAAGSAKAAMGATSQKAEPDPFADEPPNGMMALSDFSGGNAPPARPSGSSAKDNNNLEILELQSSARPAALESSHGMLDAGSAPAGAGSDVAGPAGEENLAGESKSAEPSSESFLNVLDDRKSQTHKDLDNGAARSSGTKFIFQNGEWVEVPDTPEPAKPMAGTPEKGMTSAPVKNDGVDWDKLSEPEIPQRIIEIVVEALTRGDTRYNVVVRPNDVINIPAEDVGEYFVTGHIARPGAYTLTGRQITVKEAVAAAGGFDLVAWPSPGRSWCGSCQVIRRSFARSTWTAFWPAASRHLKPHDARRHERRGSLPGDHSQLVPRELQIRVCV
ncbi:MAG: polysaccharide biosynthesis/export family protein [Phycisphaerae bacterium]